MKNNKNSKRFLALLASLGLLAVPVGMLFLASEDKTIQKPEEPENPGEGNPEEPGENPGENPGEGNPEEPGENPGENPGEPENPEEPEVSHEAGELSAYGQDLVDLKTPGERTFMIVFKNIKIKSLQVGDVQIGDAGWAMITNLEESGEIEFHFSMHSAQEDYFTTANFSAIGLDDENVELEVIVGQAPQPPADAKENQTVYRDVTTGEIKIVDESAPEGTEEILWIGYDDSGTAHRAPGSIKKVPDYISPKITDLTAMFGGTTQFNGAEVKKWDTSNVTIMIGMFSMAKAFNQDISMWNVSNVTDMTSMFRMSTKFNQDLSAWDVSSVENMTLMFNGSKAFNSKLDWSDISSLRIVSSMFNASKKFNQDISGWGTSKIEMFDAMFRDSENFKFSLVNWKTDSAKKWNDFAIGATFLTKEQCPIWPTTK
ncbi:BspA family leucine-rich repeat surface protein [[Acholeplasma] multilocale]|uniref:BspA family leucine-rich repeat surface protein n=1 Tax=[Acholeplasma] multilocale TaxID=264638 RepID=UPI000687CCF1|nr:BspA family leucine-rich repeat surface protein [[Acholeplasma] multilocale]